MDRKRALGLTNHKPGKAFNGYTLFSPYAGTTTYLIDNSGNVVHQWELGYTPCHC
jgi:hypothetical protein